MTKMTYREQLLHPNWQRKRLEALQLADFRCLACGDSETTLNVHHKHYVKGRMAWEYDAQELAVLCEPCHAAEHDTKGRRSELLARLELDGPCGIDDFMAYGAGAVFNWSSGRGMFELLDEIRDSKPMQYFAGRIAAMLANRSAISAIGLETLSDRLSGDSGFMEELEHFLSSRGIEMSGSGFTG